VSGREEIEPGDIRPPTQTPSRLRDALVPRRPRGDAAADLVIGTDVIVAARIAVVVVLGIFIAWVDVPYRGWAITAIALTFVGHMAFWYRYVHQREPLTPATAMGTILLDTIGIGVGVMLTGGVDSPMVLLWATNVAIAAIWLDTRWTLPVLGVVLVTLVLAVAVDPATDLQMTGIQSAVFAAFCLASIVAHGGVVAAQQRAALRKIDAERERARRDPLTRVLNRSALDERLPGEIERARRYDHPLTLLMVDLDDFKTVNDTRGHLAGDAVLVDVANQLTGVMRRSDLVVRFGGEEFVMVLPETGEAAAFALAERLRRRVIESPGSQGVTLSVGIAVFPDAADSPDELIQCADRALYTAKSAGKNQTVVFAPPASGETVER
jgi:diguanylate cyclase (GGDEF)-like protein